jgi:hypothetical protein
VNDLKVRLDPFWSDLGFLEECPHHLESDYNTTVGTKPGFVCLDKTDVSPKGQPRSNRVTSTPSSTNEPC